MNKKELTISASSMATFFRCSQQYKWAFLDGLEPDDGTASIYTIFGTTYHKAMELYFRFGMSYEEIVSSWKALFLSFCTETKTFTMPSNYELNGFINKGYEYLQNFSRMRERWSRFKVKDVEKYHKVPYSNQFLQNVFLTGRIDLLLEDDSSIVCFDWKTAKSKEKEIEKNIQLTFYIFFVNKLYNLKLEDVYGALAYPYDSEIIFTQRKLEEFDFWFRQIDLMLERIVASDFKKEPKLNFTPDDCHFCQYKSTCNLI